MKIFWTKFTRCNMGFNQTGVHVASIYETYSGVNLVKTGERKLYPFISETKAKEAAERICDEVIKIKAY